MFCKNCGFELTGTENVCPQCGTPVSNEQPVMINPEVSTMVESNLTPPVNTQPAIEQSTPGVGIVPEQQTANTPEQPAIAPPPSVPPVAPVMEQQTPMMGAQPMLQQPTMGAVPEGQPIQQPGVGSQNQQPNQSQQGKKLSSTTILLIAILVAVIIIGIILIIVLGRDKESPTTTGDNSTTIPDTVGTVTKNTVTFDGYTFTIPDGYETEESDEVGLVIANYDTAYTILIDHYNDYNSYKTKLKLKYPTIASDLEVTLSGRKYLLVSYKKENGLYEGTAYVTNMNDKESVIGAVLKIDGSLPPESDFDVLSQVIDSAKEGGDSSFAIDTSDKNETLELPEPSPKDITFNKN